MELSIDDAESFVDPKLVRGLLETGSADAIVAEQTAKALARRRRHRDNMVRYRQRKKVGLEEMKSEERSLVAQLQSTLSEHAAQSKSYHTRRQQSAQDQQHAQLTAHPPIVVDEFVDILTQKEQLLQENMVLRNELEGFTKFQRILREECVNELGDQEHEEAAVAAAAREKLGYWVHLVEDEGPFFYVPYTEQECRALSSKTLQRVFEFQTQNQTDVYQLSAHVVPLFDWTVSLLFEWDDKQQISMLRFTFAKTFRNPVRSLEQLVDLEWRILHDAKLYDEIHSGPIKSRVVQSFDGDLMSVKAMIAPSPEQSLKYRVLGIHFRGSYRDPLGRDGQIIAIMAIPPKKMTQADDSEYTQQLDGHACESASEQESVMWFTSGGFIHTIYRPNEVEEGAIDVEYGGKIEIVNEAHGRFHMVDLGATLIRLESLLFPFRVLQSSDSG